MAPTRRGMLSYLLGTGALLGLGSRVARAQAQAGAAAEATVTLQRLLAKNHGLSPSFGPGYSNHVSMGLFALLALGGNGRQLATFADASWGPLEPLPKEPGPDLTRDNLGRFLGQRAALNAYRRWFERELSQRGRADTLRAYLPLLLPGLGAAAFHPLIRTGYGVRFDNDAEVADGLAYWAASYLSLGELGSAGKESEPRKLLEQLRAARSSGRAAAQRGPIFERMSRAARLPEFAAAVAALQPQGEDTLRKLAAVSLELYLATGGNFTALHAVTGSHGLRMVWPHLVDEQRERAVRHLWQALAGAYLTVGTPALTAPAAPGELPGWQQIVAKAATSTDAHDLKLVDVAREEAAFYQQPRYRHAAALRLGLV